MRARSRRRRRRTAPSSGHSRRRGSRAGRRGSAPSSRRRCRRSACSARAGDRRRHPGTSAAPPRRRPAAASRSRSSIRPRPGTPRRFRRRERRWLRRRASARRRVCSRVRRKSVRTLRTRAIGSGRRRRRSSTPSPRRVIRSERSTSWTTPSSTSATSRRVELVPRSIAPTRIYLRGTSPVTARSRSRASPTAPSRVRPRASRPLETIDGGEEIVALRGCMLAARRELLDRAEQPLGRGAPAGCERDERVPRLPGSDADEDAARDGREDEKAQRSPQKGVHWLVYCRSRRGVEQSGSSPGS